MAGKNRIDFQLGFTVDKSGLEQMQSLFQQIANKAKESGNQLNISLQQAGKTAQTLDGILEKTFNSDLGTLNVTKFNQEMSKAGLTLKGVKTDLSKAGNQGATAFNKLSQAILGTNLQLKQSNQTLDKMFVTFKNTIRYGISSSIFNNVVGAIEKAYSYSKNLNTSLNDIRIVTDKSADSMERFAINANKAAKNLGASTLDYTNASLIYYQQGLSDEEAQARTETTLKAANITKQSAAEVSEQLTAVQNGYRVSAEETELYVDKLAAVAATTAADLEELSTGMSKVASAANTMGVDFDDLNAQISTIVSVTRQAPESVGTALKTIYARLGDLKVDGVDEFGVKLGEVSSQLQTMGIQILDQNGNMRDMTSVMAEVAEKQNIWTDAQRQAAAVAMAGKRQYNNLIALFENQDMYSKALETSANAMGTLQHQQDIYMESTEAKLEILKTTQQELYGDLIHTDELQDGIKTLTNLVKTFDNSISSFGGGLSAVAGAGAIIANLFNKQIIRSITEADMRLASFKQNLELVKANAEARSANVANLGENASASDLGAAANSKVQLEYAEKIYNIKSALSQEQYNDLVNRQKEIGLLEEEIVLGEKKLESFLNYNREKSILNEQDLEYIKENAQYEGMIEGYLEAQKMELTDNLEKTKNIQECQSVMFLEEEDYKNELEQINQLASVLTEEEQASQKQLLEKIKSLKDVQTSEEDILGYVKMIEQADKDNLKTLELKKSAAKTYAQTMNSVAGNKAAQTTLKQETEGILKLGASAKRTSQDLTILISGLGSFAMAQSTLGSLGRIQSDEDAEVGDQIVQTIMTLSMAVPSVISTIKNFSDAFGTATKVAKTSQTAIDAVTQSNLAQEATEELLVVAKEKRVAADALANNFIGKNTLLTKEKIATTAKEILMDETLNDVTDESIIKDKIKEALRKQGLKGKQNQVDAVYAEIQATITEKAAKDAETTSEATNAAGTDVNTVSKSKNLAVTKALTIATTALAATTVAAVAGLALLTFAMKKVADQQEAINKAREEEETSFNNQRQERRKEIEDNQTLLKSYNDLYERYKQGISSKEELANKTEELRDQLSAEDLAIVSLTGDYELLNKKILEKRKLETDKKYEQNKEDLNYNRNKIRESDYFKDNAFTLTSEQFNSMMEKATAEGQDHLIQNVNSDYTGFTSFSAGVNQNFSNSEIHQLLNSLVETGTLTKDAIIDLAPYINNISSIEKDNETVKLEKEYFDKQINSYEEYRNSLNNIINELANNKYGRNGINRATDQEIDNFVNEAVKILNTTQSGVDKYQDRAVASYAFGQKYGRRTFGANINTSDFLDSLSLEDLQVIMSGKVVIDKDTTEQDIKDQIKAINTDLEQDGSLDIVASLRTKLTSGKKLSKKELEEAMGEESKLAEEYLEFSDFENQSELEQIKSINTVGDAEIKRNEETLENAKQIAKDKIKYYEEVSAEQRKILERRDMNGGGNALSQEDQDRLKELDAILEGFPVDTVRYLQEVSENGFGFDEIDSTIFNNLINGIDGVISEANVLKSLAEDIGENQTIAAEDIERFGKNFPSIVENQENYKFLQDGSLQLTKEGQNALEEIVDLQKEEITGKYEAYRAEVEKNAAMHKAAADYYTSQADLLDAYLNNESNAADTEAALKKNLDDYQKKLTEAEVQDDARAKNQMMDNLATAQLDAQEKTNNIYDYQCAVGDTIQAVAEAQTSGKFDPPTGPAGKKASSSGGNLNEGFTSTDTDSFSSMSDDQIAKMRDLFRQRAQEELNKQSTEESKLMGIDAAIKSATNAMDRASKGKGGKESKSSSGGKDKKQDQKDLDEEFDRYWQIKKAIDMVDKAISRLDKDQENLHGKELIASLKQENQLIQEQAKNYETLYEMQKQEAEELRAQLSTMGLAFDANGAITNYAAATSAALAQYAQAVEQYNAGLIDETTFKVFEKSYENFKKLLERYDALYYTEMQDTQDKLDEMRRKQLENNLKAWEVEIQLRLDTTKAHREQNDFLKDIEQDFRKVQTDLTIDSSFDRDNFKEYMKDVDTTLKAIKDVEAEIDKMMNGGESDMFESVSQAQEKLKELQEQLLEQGKALYELYKALQQNYIDGMDQVKDKFDELMKRYKHLDNELKFQKELVELIYGDKAYDLMDKYYETQEHNIEAQIDSLRQQSDFWQEQFNESYELAKRTGADVNLDDQTTWTEDMKKAYDNMIQSQEDLNDLVLEGVKILQDKYLNSINRIMDAMDEGVWGKGGFDEMKSNQDFMQKKADEFLDDVQGMYKIQSFASKIDADIAKTANVKNQQKLLNFREQEIDALREKENLTQADLDLAEARYQIALKEIALEEAQNNKTSMKLTRNEQGNQSYQYVADEDDVAAKEQDLVDSYGNLYELANNSYEHSMELVMNLQEEMQEKMAEVANDTTLSEEAKNQKLLEIQEQYRPLMEAAATNAEIYKQEAIVATSAIFGKSCELDLSNYEHLTSEQKRLVDEYKEAAAGDYEQLRTGIIEEFYPELAEASETTFSNTNINSQTTAANVIKRQATDPDSVQAEITKAIKNISKATEDYQKQLDKLQEVAGIDFSKIGDAIDKVDQKINDMNDDTKNLTDDSSNYLDELRKLLEEVAEAQKEVSEKIQNAKQDMDDYAQATREAKAAEQQLGNPPSSPGGPTSNNNGNGDGGPGSPKTNKKKKASEDGYTYYRDPNGVAGSIRIQGNGIDIIKGGAKPISQNTDGSVKAYDQQGLADEQAQGKGYSSFYTGGYTGDWGNESGRFAMLHQKELVLNADDTKNFLSGINTIRDLTALNGSISNAIISAVAEMAMNLAGVSPGISGQGSGTTPAASNTYNITAEFPNAYSAEEIKQAILGLPNYASQYVNRNVI